ncbi:MAG: peptidylprolyl isomerase [bacterium]
MTHTPLSRPRKGKAKTTLPTLDTGVETQSALQTPEKADVHVRGIEQDVLQQTPTPAAATPKGKSSVVRRVVFSFLILLVLLVGAAAVLTIGIYRLGWKGAIVDRAVKTIPFPVALADSTVIRFSDYQEDVKTLKYYFDHNATDTTGQQQQKPSAEEMTATVINRLIYDSTVARLVEENGISVTEAELDTQATEIAKESGSQEEMDKLLSSLYGWGVPQFKQKVLRPYLELQKLGQKLDETGTLNGDAKKRADEVLAKVQAGKQTFEELAKQYSDDTTASVGGDLGFFASGTMDPTIDDALAKMKAGQTSTLVLAEDGYHILKLIETLEDQESGTQYHASDILIRTRTIDDFVNERIAQSTIRLFLPGFSWDTTNHWVVPSNQQTS